MGASRFVSSLLTILFLRGREYSDIRRNEHFRPHVEQLCPVLQLAATGHDTASLGLGCICRNHIRRNGHY